MGTLLTRNQKLRTAKQFKELFSSTSNRIYAVLGKTTGWADDNSPTTAELTPKESFNDDLTFWNDIAGVKRVLSSDVSLVAPFSDTSYLSMWDHENADTSAKTGSSYAMWKQDDQDLLTQNVPWAVFTKRNAANNADENYYRVYKTLFNNSDGASWKVPSTTLSTDILRHIGVNEDGYFWKFMYQFSATSKFFANDTGFKYIPIQTLTTDSENIQWAVQRNATNATHAEGAVIVITRTSGFSSVSSALGTGHHITFASVWKSNGKSTENNVTNYVVGDVVHNLTDGYIYTCTTANNDATFTSGNWSQGISGFVGKPVTLGTKQYINVTNSGSGYRSAQSIYVTNPTTFATVPEAAGGLPSSDSNLNSILTPVSGHGFNAEMELGAKTLMITCDFEDAESNVGTSDITTYRKVGLLLNPIVSSSSQDDISATGDTITSGTRAQGTSYGLSDLLKHSGQILYVEHRAKVTRTSPNTYRARIVIDF